MKLDKHLKAKKEFVRLFFEEYRRRWKNIQSIHGNYPSEGLVLAYCFAEAMGYYRFGFSGSKLSSIEQFIKVLFEYQSNKRFFIIPPLAIKQLPVEKAKRTIGKKIKLEVLKWLKEHYPEATSGVRIDLIWSFILKDLGGLLSESEKRQIGHLYQICWGGWYYDVIRTAGVHKAHFPKRTDEQDWIEINQAGTEILENLRTECLDKIKFPHQLPQSDSII